MRVALGLLAGGMAGLLAGALWNRRQALRASLPTVPRVDLVRYLGRWYEVARLPNRFQDQCATDVMAEYSLRPDGRVLVVNSCRDGNGATERAEGVARIADPDTNAKLRVTFRWPFAGDYWILDLGPGYDFALVGEPGRRYLWILSRTPHLDAEAWRRLVDRASALGFDTRRLIRTHHAESAPAAAVTSTT